MTTTTIPANPVIPVKKRITFWGIVGKVIAGIFKTVLLVFVIALLAPMIFFAWRAGRPMTHSQYNGLTFYQYLDWRHESYKTNTEKYLETHPNSNVKDTRVCYINESLFVLLIPYSELYTLAGKIPFLRIFINHRDFKYISTDATWANLPTLWWMTYEDLILPIATQEDATTPAIGCRLPPTPPTLEEWQKTH